VFRFTGNGFGGFRVTIQNGFPRFINLIGCQPIAAAVPVVTAPKHEDNHQNYDNYDGGNAADHHITIIHGKYRLSKKDGPQAALKL
jgi:hypothetical protein